MRVKQIIHQGLACVQVSTPEVEALISLQGAQLIRYQRSNQRPWLWENPDRTMIPDSAIRAGIPLCWPWFGDLTRNPIEVQRMHQHLASAPFHGFARSLSWECMSVHSQTQRILFELYLPEGRPGWPHPARVTLEYDFQPESLSMMLRTYNLGNDPLIISQALHTYFAVQDVRAIRLDGFDGAEYRDATDDWALKVQEGPLSICTETDRVYTGLSSELSILDHDRRILLKTTGSTSGVVWNPWVEKSKQLSQFHPDAWMHMVCVEVGNVLSDSQTISPGDSHELSLSIDVSTIL